MKSLSSIKRVFQPSWAKLSVLAAVVCSAILVVSGKPTRKEVRVYPALPVTQSPEIELPALVSEPQPERIPEAPVAVTVEAPKAEVAAKPEAAVTEVAPSEPVKEQPVRRVAKPKKGKKLSAHFHKKTSYKTPVQKVVVVAPPPRIVVPVERKDSAEDMMKAFAWLAEEKMTPAMAKRLKKIESANRLEKLADSGLEEMPQFGDYSYAVSATEKNEIAANEEEIEVVAPNLLKFAEFKQNDFADVKARLKIYKDLLKSVELKAPKAVVVPDVEKELAKVEEPTTQPESTKASAVVASLKTNPEMEEEFETEPATNEPELVKPEPKPSSVEESEKNVLAQAKPAPEPEISGPIIAPQSDNTTLSSNDAFEAMSSGGLVPQKSAPAETNVLVDTRQPQNTASSQPKPKLNIHLADSRVGRQNLSGTDPDVVYGKFSVDSSLDELLAAKNGHVEIQLVPENVKETEAVERPILEYSYPTDGDRFEIPRGKLNPKFQYKMFAKIFVQDELLPKASIAYKHSVNPFMREQIKFRATKRQYDEYLAYGANVPSNDHFLYVTVVEGMEGNREQPKTLSNARVRLVGRPASENHFVAMGDGNFKLNGVTNRSEVLVEVEADGYIKTDKVVSIFGSDTKSVVYLLSKEGLKSVRGFITDKQLDPEKAIVVGRDFNPTSAGEMVEGEQISMQYRKGQTVYFGSVFPDMSLKATSASGMFAFFNLVPAVRAIYRETFGKLPYLMNLRPYSAYLVDLGRGALRSVKGHLFDTLNRLSPEARISVLGQKDGKYFETNGNGTFEIKNVDVSNGVIMVKVENDHYPTFLYAVPVDSKENLAALKLFMMDKKRYEEVRQDLPGSSASGLGVALGGAEPSLFAQSPGCLRVELSDANGKAVDATAGPFPWGNPDKHTSTCFDVNNPRWAAKLPPGQYLSRWVDTKGKTVRSHVFFVEKDTPTMVIN